MTVLRLVTVVIFGVLLGSLSVSAFADDASDLLIKKLGAVQATLPQNDPSSVAVTLRLADLLAERARVNSMTELSQGCVDCKAGADDRKKALQLYKEAYARAPIPTRAKVLIQMGHLSQLTDNESAALKYYSDALALNPSPEVTAESNLAIAEIHFKNHNHQAAKSYYEKVLDNPSAASKGLAAYRKAWCHFNLGNLSEAQTSIETILKTPSLLTRGSTTTAQIDPQFQEEVSRDYVTFISKGDITQAKVESLFNLSPAASRVQNVQSLALEAERIGRRKEALMVWTFVFGHLANAEDRVASHASQAQLFYDLGEKTQALEHYTAAVEGVSNTQTCSSKQCDEVRRRLRQFVVSWHQSEKKNPSQELQTAYEKFIAKFPADLDMQIFAAQLSVERKDYIAAQKYYVGAIDNLAQTKADNKKLETLLLALIEVGELSKSEQASTQAYQKYLSLSPVQTKTFEVQYQLAHNTYEQGKYEAAAVELRNLAINPKGDAKIRKQAADLALDSLALLKDNARIQTWSSEFSGMFKDSDFANISQKAVLTSAAELAKTDERAAYVELSKFNSQKSSQDDRLKFLKNKLILANKLSLYGEALATADELLKQPSLADEDTQMAWGTKAEISELRLDFGSAITALDHVNSPKLTPDAKALKLALFAELANQPSGERYQTYLKLSKNAESNALVAAQLVRGSKNPAKEIEHLKIYLNTNPELLAQLYAEVLAKQYSPAMAQNILKDNKLKATPAGKVVSRVEFLKAFDGVKQKIAAAKLDTTNDRKLAASIKARIALLDQVEAKTKQALESGDWTSQFVSIDTLAKESERFYQDLMSAPVPQGLTGEEESQYLNLLAAQAAPFQSKAAEAKIKVEQFDKSDWMPTLKQSWALQELRPLIINEVEALKMISTKKDELDQFTLNSRETAQADPAPSIADITAARKSVFEQPKSQTALEHLLAVEQKAQNKPMIQYLQTRLAQLSKGAL